MIRLWHMPAGADGGELRVEGGSVWSLAFSPDGRWLTSGDGVDDGVALWDVGTGQRVRELPGKPGASLAVAFSPTGRLLVAGGTHAGQTSGFLSWQSFSADR